MEEQLHINSAEVASWSLHILHSVANHRIRSEAGNDWEFLLL